MSGKKSFPNPIFSNIFEKSIEFDAHVLTVELKAILLSEILYSWKDSLRNLLFQSKTLLESVWIKSNTFQ